MVNSRNSELKVIDLTHTVTARKFKEETPRNLEFFQLECFLDK